jgi:hypothetical protein
MGGSGTVSGPVPLLTLCRTENLGAPISRVLCEKWGFSAVSICSPHVCVFLHTLSCIPMLVVIAIAALLVVAEVLVLLRESGIAMASFMTSTSSDSMLRKVLAWEGVSFVFLATVGLTMVGLHEYDKARYFFVASAIALSLAIFTSVDKPYPKFVAGVLCAIVAGIAVNRVNDWVTRLEIAEIVKSGQDDIDKIAEKARALKGPLREGVGRGGDSHPAKCVISPGAGAGGSEYIRMCDVQLAQRVIDMAAKLEDMYDDIDQRARGATDNRKTQIFLTDGTFEEDFKKCCQSYLPSMRTEVLSRLGPVANDPVEISNWEMAFPINSSPQAFEVMHWTPYFRKLGVHLKRNVIPRKPPIDEKFTFSIHEAQGQPFPYTGEVVFAPPQPIRSGYMVMDSTPSVAMMSPFLIRSHGASMEVMDNEDLQFLLNSRMASRVVVRIGSMPVSQQNPLRIAWRSNSKPKISLRWFDE